MTASNSAISKSSHRPLDLICMGRVAVDFYGEQIGARLEDMGSFRKYLGGSSGNVAFGTARQGLKSSMLARVGNDQMGEYLREELNRVGVDTSHLITDSERLTALVVLGIKDQDTFPLIFYRDNCADMAIAPEDINEDYIASSRAFALTGTHLSHPNTRSAVIRALEYANKHSLKRILDIDYRPVLWGLTTPGDGETRYIPSSEVTNALQEVLQHFDLIVGTEEEFHIAGGTTDTIEALRKVREHSQATLVCKRGALGCSVFEHAIPDSLDEGITIYGVKVDVLNVLGAGDAFMSGLLRGYLRGEGWEMSCRYANACGALVVSRHGCSPAMPTLDELDYYLEHEREISRPDIDPMLNHLHRVTTRDRHWDELNILAFDHRIQLEQMAEDAQVSVEKIPALKSLIKKAVDTITNSENIEHSVGAFVDGKYGQDVLNDVSGSKWWLARPIELPGSRPLELENGDIGTQLRSWPLEQIVKCLLFYHPHDPVRIRHAQEKTLSEVYQACCASGHELLVEVILPEDQLQDDDYYIDVLRRFYDIGIKPDWWKLPPLSPTHWQEVDQIIETRDRYCHGVLILGKDASPDFLAQGFQNCIGSKTVKGFAVGRTIFSEPSRAWLNGKINDDVFVEQIADNFRQMIQLWRNRHSENQYEQLDSPYCCASNC